MDWTLTFDESGRFEGSAGVQGTDEPVAVVIGGLLVPAPGSTVSDRLHDWLKGRCNVLDIAFPPHGSQLLPEKRDALTKELAHGVGAFGPRGTWLFVVDRGPVSLTVEERLLRYVRMATDLVDIATRIATARGATAIDVFPALRWAPLKQGEVVTTATRMGAGFIEKDPTSGDSRIRAWIEAEVRQAIEAVGREPSGWLDRHARLSSVDPNTATYGGSNAGVFLADLGCNLVYRSLRATEQPLAEGIAASTGASTLVVHRSLVPELRQIDRALRDSPPNLVWAADALERLEALTVSVRDVPRAARDGTLAAARALWDDGTRSLSGSRALQAIPASRALAAFADARLSQKQGDFHGTWRALEVGWVGEGWLAGKIRGGCDDRELAARLWRLTVECANHRGDIASAERAGGEFQKIFASGRSLQLLAEAFTLHNLRVVNEQNRFPVTADAVQGTMERLRSETERLAALADTTEALVGMWGDEPTAELARPGDPGREKALWLAATGVSPVWPAPDRERGRSQGSIARSFAFLGDFDAARKRALEARRLFADEFDLDINAVTLARIELERTRVGSEKEGNAVLRAVLRLACLDLLVPGETPALLAKSLGERFRLDALLRGALWAPESLPFDAARLRAWVDAFHQRGAGTIFATLQSLRSHPTELISRHAGELLRAHGRQDSAKVWLELSVALAREAPEGSTLHRFEPFSEGLLANPAFAPSGPAGSVLNPTFEYR